MSFLSEIFGDCPQAKIIESFAENHEGKLYVADIARMTGVSKATVYKHLRKLVAEEVIEEKGSAGNIKFYQLNPSNPKAKITLALERFIVSEMQGRSLDAGFEEGGQNLNEAVYADEKVQHPAPGESGGGFEETAAFKEGRSILIHMASRQSQHQMVRPI